MKRYLVLSAAIILFSCGGGSEEKKEKTEKEKYEANKENLLDREKKSPQNFLVVNGRDRHNLLGQTVIKGTVTNKATVAVYKDVDVKLEFYSKTGTLLETDKETVFEIVEPGQSKNFKTKYFAPKGTDSVALSITGAKVVEK